jgi:hypothetical protein
MAEDGGTSAQGQRGAPLVSQFEAVLNALRGELSRRQQTFELDEGSDPRITQGLNWLLDNQDGDGFWGYASPGGTALCVLALGYWRPTPGSAEMTAATKWLCSSAVEGIWETPWDTAVAVRAIHLAGTEANNKVFQDASRQLLDLSPGHREVADRPHHGAQVLNTLADIGADLSYRNDWSDALTESISRDELGTSVRAQIAHALMRSGNVPPEKLSESIELLAGYLSRATLSNATFLEQAHALQALAVAKTHNDLVADNLDKIFVNQRRNGSWYHDPFLTAWALLALFEAKTVTRVVMELPAFNKHVEQARGQVRELAGRERFNAAAAVTFGAAGVTLIWIAVSLSAVTSLVITVLLAVLGAAYAVVRRIMRGQD